MAKSTGATIVNVADAKARFSELVRRALAGDEVIVARHGRPAARIVPLDAPSACRKPGTGRGRVWMARDFDRTPDDFEGDV